jgi:multiple sugar transport system ATP-binding protein
MAGLKLEGLKKRYDTVDVIKGVDLEIRDGEFVVFVGPSGCGKSTLLRMIAGLEEISGGDLFIDGKRCNDMEPRERGIGDGVPVLCALSASDGLREPLSFGLTKNARLPKAEIAMRGSPEAARDPARWSSCCERKPAAAVGRPAPARRDRPRAWCATSTVFLFDEPLSNLDAASCAMELRVEIKRLHQQLGATR